MKTVTLPKANGMPASTGTIQWMVGFAVKANQMSLGRSQQYDAKSAMVWIMEILPDGQA